MPTNFQTAANKLRAKASAQFQTPDIAAPVPQVGENVATMEYAREQPTPAVPPIAQPIPVGPTSPPVLDNIVPVQRPPTPIPPVPVVPTPPVFDAGAVVPVDRQEAIKEVLADPAQREQAAAIGGAVIGNATQDQAQKQALAAAAEQKRLADLEAARLAALRATPAPVATAPQPINGITGALIEAARRQAAAQAAAAVPPPAPVHQEVIQQVAADRARLPRSMGGLLSRE